MSVDGEGWKRGADKIINPWPKWARENWGRKNQRVDQGVEIYKKHQPNIYLGKKKEENQQHLNKRIKIKELFFRTGGEFLMLFFLLKKTE